jgi:hypothetical protein
MLQVKQDGFFPADVLFLAGTNPDGVCYLEVFQIFFTNIIIIISFVFVVIIVIMLLSL